MWEASPKWGWAVAGFVGCFAACSSSGVVLETRRGDPTPRDRDAGAVSTDQDAGPLKGVDPDSLRSGSRIHVRVQVSDGEVLSFVGLHDTLRDVDCHVQLADDGVWRCLPDPAASFTGGTFADPDCTQPVIRTDPSNAVPVCPPGTTSALPPAYEVLGEPDTAPCSSSTIMHVMTPGAQIQPTPQTYDYENVARTCQPRPLATGTAVYAMNPSPASDWVSFESTVKPVTSRLGVTQWSGADGSRMPGDTVLLPTDKPCDPGGQYVHYGLSPVDPGTVFTCIPRSTAYLGPPYYTDPACTAAVVVASECDPPELLVEPTPTSDSCGNGVNYFARGDAVTSPLYADFSPPGSGPCTPAGSGLTGQVAYAKGAPVDPATYPPMQMVLTGSGRLRHYEWQSEGVSISDAGNLVDAATGAPVTVTVFDDGVTRGVFSTTGTDKYFSDPDCKTWMLDVETSQEICGGPLPLPRWVSFDAIPTLAMPSCEGVFTQSSVRPVLGKHTGKVYTLYPGVNVEQNGACSEYVPSKSTVTYDFYDLGKPVTASSLFAEIKTIDL